MRRGVRMVEVAHGWILADPLVLGRDDEALVLLGDHAAGAVGGLQHVEQQLVGQHVQLLHVVARHVHAARQTLPAPGTRLSRRAAIFDPALDCKIVFSTLRSVWSSYISIQGPQNNIGLFLKSHCTCILIHVFE